MQITIETLSKNRAVITKRKYAGDEYFEIWFSTKQNRDHFGPQAEIFDGNFAVPLAEILDYAHGQLETFDTNKGAET